MTITLTPQIYPFISNVEKYALFTTIGRFSKMETIHLLDDDDKPAKELNSDDFVLSKGFCGTDAEYDATKPYSLYYKTDAPVKIDVVYNNRDRDYIHMGRETIEERERRQLERLENRIREHRMEFFKNKGIEFNPEEV